jgi:hypothetical protein
VEALAIIAEAADCLMVGLFASNFLTVHPPGPMIGAEGASCKSRSSRFYTIASRALLPSSLTGSVRPTSCGPSPRQRTGGHPGSQPP